MKTCLSCKYFVPSSRDQGGGSSKKAGEWGWCYRYPPSPVGDSGHFDFPRMTKHDWCGEYREKKALPVK